MSSINQRSLQKRLIVHAARLLELSSSLRKTAQTTHVSRQLLRSATAAAANYGEARGAESRPDFVHKLRLVLKELNETGVWLQLILECSYSDEEVVLLRASENDELCRILAASIKTAGGFVRT